MNGQLLIFNKVILSIRRVTCDVWRVACDVWRVTCDVWRVACDVWRVTCDVWRVACRVWCLACGDWPLTYNQWPVTCDPWRETDLVYFQHYAIFRQICDGHKRISNIWIPFDHTTHANSFGPVKIVFNISIQIHIIYNIKQHTVKQISDIYVAQEYCSQRAILSHWLKCRACSRV